MKESGRTSTPENGDFPSMSDQGLKRENNSLPGKWLVHCPAGLLNRRELIEILLKLSLIVDPKASTETPVEIRVSANGPELRLKLKLAAKSFFYLPDDNEIIEVANDDELKNPPPGFPSWQAEQISLVFPSLPSDRRWRSIGLPTAHLFLGSTLTAAGYRVSSQVIPLPAVLPPEKVRSGELLGLTLFADLFPEISAYIEQLEVEPKALLAAGGPLVSNCFLPAVLNLPRVNLFIRGEAEFALPAALKALAAGDFHSLFSIPGFFLHLPPWLLLSGSDLINRPEDFASIVFNLSYCSSQQLEKGLEIALSRGCRRNCIFCSQVSGRRLRQLPPDKFGQLLDCYLAQAGRLGVETVLERTVNINDDDLLQDLSYAAKVFSEMENRGFSSWGIQTSPASFLGTENGLNPDTLELASRPELFFSGRPLLWLGTDVFLPERAGRLGKPLLPERVFHRLLAAFEEKEIQHCHYWISSDGQSDWLEFCREFISIIRLAEKYSRFRLLAHAPFIVPYPETALFRLLQSGQAEGKVVFRKRPENHTENRQLLLVSRLETNWPELNHLLQNRSLEPRPGFLDLLAENDFPTATLAAYDFLRRERMGIQKNDSRQICLKAAQELLESYLES